MRYLTDDTDKFIFFIVDNIIDIKAGIFINFNNVILFKFQILSFDGFVFFQTLQPFDIRFIQYIIKGIGIAPYDTVDIT